MHTAYSFQPNLTWGSGFVGGEVQLLKRLVKRPQKLQIVNLGRELWGNMEIEILFKRSPTMGLVFPQKHNFCVPISSVSWMLHAPALDAL